ncbi:hypothetical protein GALMADRAFT_572950 [Galerina marginata CBS 339.88]|uniref:Uncharacterized protein n=1 Tax=Galerina marginata (strain CBS 339.88) TaxID=685588 RepID=A0A067T2R9_GALM3|nr:hypothetical protein GALMADRAFT_572950 [Galerina marginata CBS 339.88]
MNFAWQLLGLFSVQRPSYVSEEKLFGRYAGYHTPVVTTYRLLVCSAVVSFGMSKAMLGYYGSSTALTWTDWALAVPITTCLYILGLYEYNSLNVWSSFFQADQSEILYSATIFIKYIAEILLVFSGTFGMTYGMWLMLQHPSWQIARAEDDKVTFRTRLDDWSTFGCRLFILDFILLTIACGATALFFILRSVVRDVTERGSLVRKVLRIVRRPILHVAKVVVPSLAERSPHPVSSYNRFHYIFTFLKRTFRVFIRITLYLVGLVGCLTFNLISLGTMLVWYDVMNDKKVSLFKRMIFAGVLLLTGFGTLSFTFQFLDFISLSLITGLKDDSLIGS